MKENQRGRVFGVYIKNPEIVKKIKEDCKKIKRTPSDFLNILVEKHYEQKEILSEAE